VYTSFEEATGANLHVVNGTGTTDGPVNGLGNVIIGYSDEREIGSDRIEVTA